MGRLSGASIIALIQTLFLCGLLINPFLIIASSTTYYWNIEEVGIPDAWEYTQGSPDITVAIIDSGVDFTHPDLENSMWRNLKEIPNNGWDDDKNGYIDDYLGWDFQSSDNDPSPPLPPVIGSKHGTFIAGLIAADDDDNIFVGVAPRVKIMSLRFLRPDLSFTFTDWPKLVSAINYAVQEGAEIINLSIQANGTPPNDVYEAIRNAYQAGVIIVSVTGNRESQVTYPGNYSEVIAVSATSSSRVIADFSTPGEQNEICAPGDDVYSITGYNSSVILGSGTSFAAPLVSGAFALLMSLNSGLGIEELRMILQESCTDLGEEGKDLVYGYGLLNITNALAIVSSNLSTSTGTSENTTPSSESSTFNRLGSDVLMLGISYIVLLSFVGLLLIKKDFH